MDNYNLIIDTTHATPTQITEDVSCFTYDFYPTNQDIKNILSFNDKKEMNFTDILNQAKNEYKEKKCIKKMN